MRKIRGRNRGAHNKQKVVGKIILLSPEEITRWTQKDLTCEKVSEDKEGVGWVLTETVGIGIANPRGVVRTSMGVAEEKLTEEEKLERKFLNKGW